MKTTLRNVALWLVIALGFVVLYVTRDDAARLAAKVYAALVPGAAVSTGQVGEVIIHSNQRSGFDVPARLNGVAVRLRFDTGASHVVLTAETAKAIGLTIAPGDYNVPVSTAGGRTLTAPARLKRLEIGAIGESQVQALIARPGDLEDNLLGMSFLARLSSYEVKGATLVLRGQSSGEK